MKGWTYFCDYYDSQGLGKGSHKLLFPLWNFQPVDQGWQWWWWWILIIRKHEISHLMRCFKGYHQEDYLKHLCPYFFIQKIKPKDWHIVVFPTLFKGNNLKCMNQPFTFYKSFFSVFYWEHFYERDFSMTQNNLH